jgi:hypothetical protein
MSIVTSQQLARYYEQFKNNEVTFNKQVISATGLVSRNVYLKVQDRQVPCFVFAASMTGARVVATVAPAVATALKQGNCHLALRWCFKQPEKVEPITFFVTCHPTGFTHYAVQGPDVQIITVEFTQRPPDDLIQILGTLIEANTNSQRRRDERIPVTLETLKKLGLDTREAALEVDARIHRCVLRDLSFSGAKIVASGSAEAFNGKPISLTITRGDQAGDLHLTGMVRRVEDVGGRADIQSVSIEYVGDPGMGYKLLINAYLSSVRKAAPEAAPSAEGSGTTNG